MKTLLTAVLLSSLFACSVQADAPRETLPSASQGPFCQVEVGEVTWRLSSPCDVGQACATAYGAGACVPALTCYDSYSGKAVAGECHAEGDRCALPEGVCGVTR